MGNQQKQSKDFKQVIRLEQYGPNNNNKRQSKNPQEFECLIFDTFQKRQLKKKYQIKINKEDEIVYLYNGQIVRLIRNCSFLDSEVFNNLEQIQNLEWFGKYGKNFKKVGKWAINWNRQVLQNVGGYYSEEEYKIGLWKELNKNYCSYIPVFEEGEYYDDKKIGKWKYLQKNGNMYYFTGIISGGGYYKDDLKKIGKWIELQEDFWSDAQVTYQGEYNVKGMKIGLWDINYCDKNQQNYQQVGGGSYNQEGQKKIGKWVELWEKFRSDAKVIYHGEYDIKGMKTGMWEIKYYQKNEQQYQQIGGGTYDQEGIKIGKWIELDEGFWGNKQVTYNGEYNIKGMKKGRWDILFEGRLIGGGFYSQQGIKFGRWVELGEGFHIWAQIIYNGEYNTNGMKIGRWAFVFEGKQIGGGSYDKEGMKIGRWIDLYEGFYYWAQVTYNGEYNTKGVKVGRWDICLPEKGLLFGQNYKKIGGGSYQEDGIKIGWWVELDEGFWMGKQITFNCEYSKQGMKICTYVQKETEENGQENKQNFDFIQKIL